MDDLTETPLSKTYQTEIQTRGQLQSQSEKTVK